MEDYANQHCTTMYHLDYIEWHLEGSEGIDKSKGTRVGSQRALTQVVEPSKLTCFQVNKKQLYTDFSNKDLHDKETRTKYLWDNYKYKVPEKEENTASANNNNTEKRRSPILRIIIIKHVFSH
eukprot:5568998-Ditylum_brightwellii.AAC.1